MNNKISSISALIGAAFVASASLAPVVSAADATFAATSLETGYTLADNHATKSEGEHKCGEGKCAADHKKAGEDGKAGEGKCGEGKCGEGKCGTDKKEKSKDTSNNTSKDTKEEKKAE